MLKKQGRDLARRHSLEGGGGASRSAPQPSRGQAGGVQGDEWTSLGVNLPSSPAQRPGEGRDEAEAAPHTDPLFSAGRRKACVKVVGGGGGEASRGLRPGPGPGPFPELGKPVRRAHVSFCPKGFLGLPSRKRQLISFFAALASSRQERTGTEEMPAPLVIRTGRK